MRRYGYVLTHPSKFDLLPNTAKNADHLYSELRRLADYEQLQVANDGRYPAAAVENSIDLFDLFQRPQMLYLHLSTSLGLGSAPALARLFTYLLLTAAKRPYSALTAKPEGYKPKESTESATAWRWRWNQPAVWSDFETACGLSDSPAIEGLSFVLHPGGDDRKQDRILCVDFDDAFENGKPRKWVQKILDEADSYVEVSRSGKGLHLFLVAECEPFTNVSHSKQAGGGAIEVLCSSQVAVTGNPYPSSGCSYSWGGKLTGNYGLYAELLRSKYRLVANRPHDSNELRRVLKEHALELHTCFDIVVDLNGSSVSVYDGEYLEALMEDIEDVLP